MAEQLRQEHVEPSPHPEQPWRPEPEVRERTATVRHLRPERSERPLASLITDLFRETAALVRGEVELAKVEINQKVTDAQMGVVSLATGFILVFSGFLILLGAAVFGLGLIIPYWASAVAIGGGVFIIGLIAFAMARRKLRAHNLAPRATAASLRRDQDLAREHTS